jgi:hypothetical protein
LDGEGEEGKQRRGAIREHREKRKRQGIQRRGGRRERDICMFNGAMVGFEDEGVHTKRTDSKDYVIKDWAVSLAYHAVQSGSLRTQVAVKLVDDQSLSVFL